ncbi:PASTA domain-containing protein [Cellulomonas sp. C5510]|uniref:protein kinase domain-containing protein n=1 Tax=Cellulomonas sp. C5510 TaxID=2871170 RepID=UPI001C96EBA1|nr:PASTA domain-containing protein [Cellulomonas sp. C5510]QZN86852.1 protein kinase [Cellulomonas sp. C5510]
MTGTADATLGGRFVIGDLLGVGGSASVYEAEDLQRSDDDGAPVRVAVKVLHPHLGADAWTRDAFLAEARAVQGLRHPNVAAVHGSGLHEAGGVTMAWIALDLVPGGSVGDRVAAEGPMTPLAAGAVLDGVLAALEAAHARGLVHRDVSPGNVLLARGTGSIRAADVRLVDFGLADAAGRTAAGSDVLRAPVRDGSASVVGNLHFLSPEQAQALPVGPAGDVYQVGALAHLLLTGQPPFPRATAVQVLQAHVTAPPPVPSALVPAARPLDRVVTRALAKTPLRRYRDAAEMRSALAAVLVGLTQPDPPAWTTADATPEVSRTRALPAAGDLAYLAAADGPEPRGPHSAAARVPTGGVLACVAVALVVGLATWGVLGGDAAPQVAVPPAASPSASAAATSAPSTAPVAVPPPADATSPPAVAEAPSAVAVPVLVGSLADAQATLLLAGLVLGGVQDEDSPLAADVVLGQVPAAGSPVAPGTAVDVVVASGANEVPAVAGLTVASATATLEVAGFVVQGDPAATSGARVTGTLPGAGAVLRVGSAITVVREEPAPTAAPTEQPSAGSGA